MVNSTAAMAGEICGSWQAAPSMGSQAPPNRTLHPPPRKNRGAVRSHRPDLLRRVGPTQIAPSRDLASADETEACCATAQSVSERRESTGFQPFYTEQHQTALSYTWTRS